MNREESKRINDYILIHYKSRSTESLAKELNISVANLQKRASRLGIKKESVANAIVDGKKLCCICHQMKDITEFRKDKYQNTNVPGLHLDYRCKECRNTKRTKEEKEPTIVRKGNSYAFHRRKTKSVIINEHIKCRGFCRSWKHKDEFSVDMKNKVHNRKNYCKKCMHKLYEMNKQLQEEEIKRQEEEG